jgi:hypothetical protein
MPPVKLLKTANLFRSQTFGHKGDDTMAFDDAAAGKFYLSPPILCKHNRIPISVAQIPHAPSITRILKIVLQHGRFVNYIAVTYVLNNGETYTQTHGQIFNSPLGFGYRWEIIDLSGGL